MRLGDRDGVARDEGGLLGGDGETEDRAERRCGDLNEAERIRQRGYRMEDGPASGRPVAWYRNRPG
jgi:hypothetical protein